MANSSRNIRILDNFDKQRDLAECHKENTAFIVVLVVIYFCIALVAILGNGMVLAVTCGKKTNSRLKILDGIVKSLAVADMLYGLIGMPCRVVFL